MLFKNVCERKVMTALFKKIAFISIVIFVIVQVNAAMIQDSLVNEFHLSYEKNNQVVQRATQFFLTQIIPSTSLEKIPDLFEKTYQKNPAVIAQLLYTWFNLPVTFPIKLGWHIVHMFSTPIFELKDKNKKATA